MLCVTPTWDFASGSVTGYVFFRSGGVTLRLSYAGIGVVKAGLHGSARRCRVKRNSIGFCCTCPGVYENYPGVSNKG